MLSKLTGYWEAPLMGRDGNQQLKHSLSILAAIVTLAIGIFLTLGDSAFGQPLSAEVTQAGGGANFKLVDSATLREAMKDELALDYDAAATTNRARFFAGVAFQLATDAIEADPDGPPLLVPHEVFYWTFLDEIGLSEEEAPISIRRIYENNQDAMIDYNQDRVVKRIKKGPDPKLALNIQIFWQGGENVPDMYSFEDTTSTPKLRVTNHRLIRYRLLYFDDMVVFDNMTGLTGRPLSGVLAALFSLIGDGRVAWSRLAVSSDGLQVIRAQAKKGFFSKTETVVVYPDGRATRDIPQDSTELFAIEDRLKQDLDVDYYDWVLPEMD